MRQLALIDGVVLTPFEMVEDAVVLIEGTKIKAVKPRAEVEIPADYRQISVEGLIIVPGFIDQHLHGGGGGEVMNGTVAGLAETAKFHAVHGTTAFLATTMAATKAQLMEIGEAYRGFQAGEYKGATCLGLHLEGPYLARRFAGIHDSECLREPSFEEIDELQRLSNEGLKMITMAPDVPGVLELGKKLSNEGIVCSIGHSNADCETAILAADNGFRCITHCFNQIRPFHHREPGVVGAALTDPRFSIEIIADGEHLHPKTIDLAWRLKGPEQVILVSDAMLPTGLLDGAYNSAAGELWLERGRLVNCQGRLAGSVTTLEVALKNLMDYTDCELTDALRTITYNPARNLGINKHKGSLYPGKDADIVVLTPQLEVVMTMIGGEVISGLIAVE